MFCHQCGNKIQEGANFCTECGTKILTQQEKTATPVEVNNEEIKTQPESPVVVEEVNTEALQRQKELEQREAQLKEEQLKKEQALREQKEKERQEKLKKRQEQRQKIKAKAQSIGKELIPNRQNLLKVARSVKQHMITLLLVILLLLMPWEYNSVRVTIFFIYLLLLYFVTLLNKEKIFHYEKMIESLLKGKERPKPVKIKAVKERKTRVEKVHTQNNPSLAKQRFKLTKECLAGVVLFVGGFLSYRMNIGSMSSGAEQFTSMITEQSLSSAGYFVIIGIGAMFLGILAFIGGGIKGFAREKQGGEVFKWIATALVAICCGIAMYIYAHPVETAIQGASSLIDSAMSDPSGLESNVNSLTTMITISPYVIAIVYIIGIIQNLMKKKVKGMK